MSAREKKCENAKETLFNFEDFILDIADLFMWLFHYGFEFECDEISSKRKATLIDRIE